MGSFTGALRNLRRDPARRNFFANLMDGTLYAFGMSLVSLQTVMPVFVKEIGGGNVAVGLIPVVWVFGFNFPQILVAGYAQRETRKKALLLKTAMGQRIPWLLLAVAAYVLFEDLGSGPSLALFFVLLGLAAVGGSINLPVWFDLIARLTPVQRRGRLFGSRTVLGAVLGLLGGAVVTLVLDTVPGTRGYALLLMLCFLAMMLSYVFLVSLREGPQDVRDPGRRQRPPARALPGLLRSNHNYRNFLIADALQISASMGAAFYTVHALEKFSLPPSTVGAFTVIMMAGSIVSSLVFGMLADRFGHRVSLVAASAATLVACAGALTAQGIVAYGIVFFCASVAVALPMVSRLPFLAELSSAEERPSLVALANMVTSPFILWGVVAGWLADAWGYDVVFWLGGVHATASLAWYLAKVREPRAAADARVSAG